ncbi:UNVERIFIED_CONTAM: hypothetical protein FKN15_043789, partial [Acipenser sinensis]
RVLDLQETVSALLEEKKQLTCQLQEQQSHIEELSARIEKQQADMKELHETIETQSKTIKRFNRVSMMATQEYGNLREQLDLELSLREKAESYAHEMLIKQKEANRQSMILLQQADPSMQLLKALEDVANVTKTLEQERLQRQRQVKDLEAQLQESALRRQLGEMQKHLELMEEEKRELEVRVQRAEERSSSMEHQGGWQVKDLEAQLQESALRRQLGEMQKHLELMEEEKRELEVRVQRAEERSSSMEHQGLYSSNAIVYPPQTVQELQEKQKSWDSAPGPAPGTAPPPAPPPQPPPYSSLIAIMRKSSKSSKGSPKSEPAPGAPVSVGADDVKVKAVNEMMERIKHGVVLRPVKGQATKQQPPQMPAPDETAQESAMEELKGILETVKKSPSRGFPEVAPTKKDSELEVILRRRRKQNCDPSSGDVKGGEMSKVSSSESLNARNSLDSSKETVQSCHGGSTRSSLSEKGSEGGTNGCCDSCEDGERTHSAEKCVQSNGISMDLPSHGKHSTKTPCSPVSSDPVNTSTDAEC